MRKRIGLAMTGGYIEPVGSQHIHELQRLLDEPEVSAPLDFPTPFPAGGAARFVAARRSAWAGRSAYTFAIIACGHCVGTCALRFVPAPENTWELGFWIGKPYWGRGIAPAAVECLFAFSRTREIKSVTAFCRVNNLASIRVLDKLRFSQPLLIKQRDGERGIEQPLYWFWREL